VSRPQARFEGSARQARGRLLAALASGPLGAAEVGAHDAAVVASLLSDGLVTIGDDGSLRLPD
jgi:hypothetical protein